MKHGTLPVPPLAVDETVPAILCVSSPWLAELDLLRAEGDL